MLLQALFDGQIYPSEDVKTRSKRYLEATNSANAAMRYFEQTLSSKDYQRLEAMTSDLYDARSEENAEHFKNGFALGMRLMQEVYRYPVLRKKD